MQITVNIEKRHAFMVFGAILILTVAIGINAYGINPGAVPNPGHSLDSVQGLFSGDSNLQETLNTKFCQSDGTNCITYANSAPWANLTAEWNETHIPDEVPVGFMHGFCRYISGKCYDYYSIEPCYCLTLEDAACYGENYKVVALGSGFTCMKDKPEYPS